ncbi:hypothetical protein V5O48_003239 [Marasmius crinis-equi]|uniref:MYND-type domain-containing protein n=1 Tax=Marasmius crinis-equi TaxID=585013 RepID=A0ABR3FUE5_9AGAR
MLIFEILDHPFIQQSNDHFPTVKSATEHLRRLGKQIPSRSVDRFYPPDTLLWTIVEIFAALSSNIRGRNGPDASLQIVKDWKSAIWPWFKFLLEHVVLSSTETSTRLRFETYEYALMFVPPLLAFEDSELCRDSQIAIIQATPELTLLITRVLCKLVTEGHIRWGFWSTMTMAVFQVLPGHLPLMKPSSLKVDHQHESNVSLGRAFIRHIHIHAQSQRLPTMSIEELTNLKAFLMCAMGPLFKDSGPLALQEIRRSSIAALSSLVCSVLSKQKILRKADVDSEECQNLHDMAIMALCYLNDIVDDAYCVTEVLDTGFIKALFKSHRCLFQVAAKRLVSHPSLSYCLCQIIDRISRFMPFSSVVHQFSRAERRYLNEETLGVLRSKSPAVWDCLKLAATKAATWRDIRSAMRESDLSFMCCNDQQCPLKMSEEVLEHRTPFLLCSSCLNATYCSRECQKIDWDSGHRDLCAEKARRQKDSRTAFLSEHEWRLFNGFAMEYFARNWFYIKSRLDTFLLDLSKRNRADLSDDDRLVMDRKKNPIVFLDFDRSPSPIPDNTVHLFGLDAFVTHFREKAPWVYNAVEEWRGPTTNGSRTLVVAFFPGKGSFPISVRLFPQRLGRSWSFRDLEEEPES